MKIGSFGRRVGQAADKARRPTFSQNIHMVGRRSRCSLVPPYKSNEDRDSGDQEIRLSFSENMHCGIIYGSKNPSMNYSAF